MLARQLPVAEGLVLDAGGQRRCRDPLDAVGGTGRRNEPWSLLNDERRSGQARAAAVVFSNHGPQVVGWFSL